MKIAVLNDNRFNGKCLCEHGLSLFIETDEGLKILFDTGPSDLFLKNAEFLGIDLNGVNCVVLSHGHWDHGNGLGYINGKELICHPSCFLKRFRKKDKSYIGLKLSEQEIEKEFQLVRSETPYRISENIFFLGAIPRKNAFESIETPFCLEDGADDFVPDDSALAITSDLGLIVISGCAHSGICNTVEYAKKVAEENKIYAVVGGFHLKTIDDTTLKTIEYFKMNDVKKVFPCHCVENEVIDYFAKEFGLSPILSGNEIKL